MKLKRPVITDKNNLTLKVDKLKDGANFIKFDYNYYYRWFIVGRESSSEIFWTNTSKEFKKYCKWRLTSNSIILYGIFVI